MKIERFSEADKAYLANFTALNILALNATHLKSFANLPDWQALIRLEANDN
jgi:hypothetical protein